MIVTPYPEREGMIQMSVSQDDGSNPIFMQYPEIPSYDQVSNDYSAYLSRIGGQS